MENKKAFLKEDLIIFARYLSRRVEPIIAYKFIKPNKQYVFVGIFNKDKTKVKNVLTGEVLKINGIYAWNRLERYLIFPAPDFSNRINECFTDENDNCDIYRGLCCNDYIFSPQIISIKDIKKFVDETNESIHSTYKQLIKKGELQYKEQQRLSNTAKLTNKERDF